MTLSNISESLGAKSDTDAFVPTIPLAKSPSGKPASEKDVVLADGTRRNLAGLTRDEFIALQWQQEKAFAARIIASPKGSAARADVTCQAYDTVTSILAAVRGTGAGSLLMGLHPKHERLVLDLLAQQQRQGLDARFFEIGYASGTLLKRVGDAGYVFAGIEISKAMRTMAVQLLGKEHRDRLYLGDFLALDPSAARNRWSLVYWNDIFEHIVPDEIGDWLKRIHKMLVPGGQLVTITPNWHVRPSDATMAIHPPRTEAAGLHLKEYTLREVTHLLRQAGFESVATPLAVSSNHIVRCRNGLLGLKCFFEPALEWLPFPLAKLACRGLGLSCTIATKK
ncbi:MAG: class I SAM-dependent methyltransferase [Thermoguttaceae bacterium]